MRSSDERFPNQASRPRSMPVTVGGVEPVVSVDTIRSFEVADATGTPPMLAVIGRLSVIDGVPRAEAEAPGLTQAETACVEPPEKETLVEYGRDTSPSSVASRMPKRTSVPNE